MKLFVILFFSSISDCILSMAVLKKKSIRYSSVRSFRMNLNALIYSSLFFTRNDKYRLIFFQQNEVGKHSSKSAVPVSERMEIFIKTE